MHSFFSLLNLFVLEEAIEIQLKTIIIIKTFFYFINIE